VDGFAGEAFTTRFIPAREDVNPLDRYNSGNTLQWDPIENVSGPRDRGRQPWDTSAAHGGDMLMTRAMVRGAAGFVTDGGLRDGVVVVCRPMVAEIAQPALEQEQIEAYLHTRLQAGRPCEGATRRVTRPGPSIGISWTGPGSHPLGSAQD